MKKAQTITVDIWARGSREGNVCDMKEGVSICFCKGKSCVVKKPADFDQLNKFVDKRDLVSKREFDKVAS